VVEKAPGSYFSEGAAEAEREKEKTMRTVFPLSHYNVPLPGARRF
jgi:hypothetical protein